jgi:phage terminase small subunit
MLTPKQSLFVKEYLVDLNATQAAIRSGYSAKTLSSMGEQLLRKIEIRAAVDDAMRKRAQRTEFNADRVLKEIERVATVDPIHLVNDDGTLKQMQDIPEDVRRAIASFEIIETFEWVGEGKERRREWTGYLKKMKLVPKNESLNMAGRHFKMFTDVLDVNVGEAASALDKAKGRR